MVRISFRKFLIAVLMVLLILILALAYLYYLLLKPPGADAYRTAELQPLFSIYGKSTRPEDLLKRPNDVAFDGAGNIYVADSENGRIFVFDRSGRFIRQIGKRGRRKGELMVPMGVTVAENGKVFVTDKALSKIAIFDNKGALLQEFTVPHPMKPVVAGAKLYLTSSQAIYVYSLNGRLLSKIGRKGKAMGEFDYPFGIAIDGAGRIYVADLMNLRVQALDRKGEPIWVKGFPPKDIMGKDRTFGLPAGLALGGDGRLYLVDSFFNQITILAKDGNIVGSVAKRGNREGELYYPAGIASRGDGIFAVADKYNDRVQILRIKIEDKLKRS